MKVRVPSNGLTPSFGTHAGVWSVWFIALAACGCRENPPSRSIELAIDQHLQERSEVSINTAIEGLPDDIAEARSIAKHGGIALRIVDSRLRGAKSESERINILILLGYFRENDAAEIVLREAERRKMSALEQVWAIEVLERHPHRDTLDALVVLCEHPSVRVRMSACHRIS